MMKKTSGPRLGLYWAVYVATACTYAMMGWKGALGAALSVASWLSIRSFGSAKLQGFTLVLALLAVAPMLTALLAGGACLLMGAVLCLCYPIILPKAFFHVVLLSILIFAGLRPLLRRGSPAAIRVCALIALLLGLATSPAAWQRLRNAADAEPQTPLSVLGWRFRFSGPESGTERPRFYVKTGQPAHPYEPVPVCPPGTRPRAAKRIDQGMLCD